MFSPARFTHYRTGNLAIDTAHYELLMSISNIIAACTHQHPGVADQLIQLRVDLVDHSAYELSQMVVAKYPYILSHVNNHTKMLHKLDSIINTAGGPNYIVVKSVLDALSTSLLAHIDHYVIQFVNWVSTQRPDFDLTTVHKN